MALFDIVRISHTLVIFIKRIIMFITNNKKWFFIITGVILTMAISSIFYFGLPLGIDFTGGSLVQVSYNTSARPAISVLKKDVAVVPLGNISLRDLGTKEVALRTRTLTPKEHTAVLTALSPKGFPATELQFMSVGPTIGAELGRKALVALAVVIFSIVLYIAWAFRKVSRPVSSWVYGSIVVVILFHDMLIPAGFFALWAYFTGAQVNALFVVALLTISGYSVNDTIVIFDRVREHLAHGAQATTTKEFASLVGQSIKQTMGRSINTSLTVILALSALAIFGSHATFSFALVLIVGVIAGTYSSILLAAPLLIPVAHYFMERRERKSR